MYATGFTTISALAFDGKDLLVLEFAARGRLDRNSPGVLIRLQSNGRRTVLASAGLVAPTGLAVAVGTIYGSNYGTSPGNGAGPHGEIVTIPSDRMTLSASFWWRTRLALGASLYRSRRLAYPTSKDERVLPGVAMKVHRPVVSLNDTDRLPVNAPRATATVCDTGRSITNPLRGLWLTTVNVYLPGSSLLGDLPAWSRVIFPFAAITTLSEPTEGCTPDPTTSCEVKVPGDPVSAAGGEPTTCDEVEN